MINCLLSAWCSDLLVCAVKNLENGISIFCGPATPSVSQPSSFTVNITDHHLPSLECGDSYTGCALSFFVLGSTVNMFVPAEGGFVHVTYTEGEMLQYQFKKVSESCNPTALFPLNNDGFRLVMSCFNFTLQGDGKGSLYFVEFNNQTGVLRQSQRLPRRLGLEPPNVALKVVFVRDLRGCLFIEALYTLYHSNLLYVSTDIDQNPDFKFGNHISSDFSQINDIEYNRGKDNLIVYSDRSCVEVDVCANTQDHFSSEGVYPCKNTDVVLTYKNDNLRASGSGNVSGSSIPFPVGTLIHGKCVGVENYLTFWGLARNGSLFSVRITGDDHTVFKLVSAVCTESVTCLRPVYEENGLFGSFVDPDRMTVSIVNLTSSCGTLQVPLPFPPDMFIVAPLPGEHVCHCSIGTEISTSAGTIGAIAAVVIVFLGLVLGACLIFMIVG